MLMVVMMMMVITIMVMTMMRGDRWVVLMKEEAQEGSLLINIDDYVDGVGDGDDVDNWGQVVDLNEGGGLAGISLDEGMHSCVNEPLLLTFIQIMQRIKLGRF